MAQRRIYEMAKEHGVPTAELLRRLNACGVTGKRPGSAIDPAVVEAALEGSVPNGNGVLDTDADAEQPDDERRPRSPEVVDRPAAVASAPAESASPSSPPRAANRNGGRRTAARSGGGDRGDSPDPSDASERRPPARDPSRPAQPRAVPSRAPGARATAQRPDLWSRLLLRRRLWELRRRRNAQLRDLAGLTVELARLETSRPDIVDRRIAAAAATDEQLLALERQLDPEALGGTCPECGLEATENRYCRRCGTALPGRHHPERTSLLAAAGAVLAIAAAWLLGGIIVSGPDQNGQRATAARAQVAGALVRSRHRRPGAAQGFETLVALARPKVTQIRVYRHRGDRHAYLSLSNPNVDGARLVFLVKSTAGGWLHVLLPTRPNGSSGWIRRKRVMLAGHSYRLRVDLTRHVLTAWKGSSVLLRTPVGVGRAVTPTPAGLYYITELLKQPDPTGVYGPYAFGLSAHSNVLHEFAGADGILGIHGTDYPRGIGTNVSHGCIRVSNAAIRKLARLLPVGTPVRIVRE